jgi:hypothetical protein
MNTKQQNKLAMYLATKAILDKNNAIWQPLPAFADGYAVLNMQVGIIQTLGQNQNLDTTGVAVDKRQAKFAMAQTAVGIALPVRAYAVKNKNNTLATEVDFVQSDITNARDADAVEHCQNIHDLANTNLAALATYGITAAKLTGLQTVIATFDGLKGLPRQNITTGKTATKQLNDAFDLADETLNEILDNLVGQFEEANPKFVSDYHNARVIVDLAAGRNGEEPPAPKPMDTPKA